MTGSPREHDQDHDNSDGHEGGHVHVHDHSHDGAHPHDRPVPEHLDLSVPDADLTPHQLGRRRFFRRAGLLGVAAATNVLGGSLASPALADEPRRRGEGTSGAAPPALAHG